MNGYRVLVVEDDDASREALRRAFHHRGWLVSVASTVTEGMAKLSPPPHCIILDLTLPDGKGEEILRKIHEEKLPTRVAVCTGTSDPVRIALVKGMDPLGLFQKPLDFDEVFAACDDDTIH